MGWWSFLAEQQTFTVGFRLELVVNSHRKVGKDTPGRGLVRNLFNNFADIAGPFGNRSRASPTPYQMLRISQIDRCSYWAVK